MKSLEGTKTFWRMLGREKWKDRVIFLSAGKAQEMKRKMKLGKASIAASPIWGKARVN